MNDNSALYDRARQFRERLQQQSSQSAATPSSQSIASPVPYPPGIPSPHEPSATSPQPPSQVSLNTPSFAAPPQYHVLAAALKPPFSPSDMAQDRLKDLESRQQKAMADFQAQLALQMQELQASLTPKPDPCLAELESVKLELSALKEQHRNLVEEFEATTNVCETLYSETEEKDAQLDRMKTLETSFSRLEAQKTEIERALASEKAEHQQDKLLWDAASKSPKTFLKVDGGETAALEILKTTKAVSDQDLLSTFQAKVEFLSEHDLKSIRGAFLVLCHKRHSDTLLPYYLALLRDELAAYLDSLSVVYPPSLLPAIDQESSSEALAAVKTRAAKLDSKLNVLQRNYEAKVSEVATWRQKAEGLERERDKEREAPAYKKASILAEDLAREKQGKAVIEKQLSALRVKHQELETRCAKLKTEADAQKAKARGASDSEAGEKVEKAGDGATPASTTATSDQKFVIRRLADTVKTLSAQLTTKTAENAELMLRLVNSSGGGASVGDDQSEEL